MFAEQRRKLIAETVAQAGRVGVADLSHRFEVAGETIRRDLDSLAERRMLVRVHGGAVAVGTTVDEPDLETRLQTNVPQKRRIAQAALRFVPTEPGASVLLDAGSTVAELAVLLGGRELVIFTDAVPVAAAASQLRGLEVHVLPGRVRGVTRAAVGADTVEYLGRLRVDVAFLGSNGIDAGGFATPDVDEAAAKRSMVRAARRRVVLVDSSKTRAHPLCVFAEPGEVDAVVSDAELPAALRAELAQQGAEVVLA